ncbi:MAG: MBOAT family protein [Bacteroidetes bacterium]|nr:MBOAT family protein [Bacteroidota bacterium]
MLVLSGIAFGSAILISKSPEGNRRKYLLIISLILIFSSLFFFKYYNFFIESLGIALAGIGFSTQTRILGIILPLGVSFYTFQLSGYILDIYWEKREAERNPVTFFAFSSFFPLILSGPVERSTNLLKQMNTVARINWDDIAAGLKMILWGLFKKLVIADNLSAYINQVYQGPSGYNSVTLFFTAMLFMVQLYADFSGYSDIAIGSAKLLGFDLIKNFNLPFFAKSFADFWRKWHISLTTWLFEYIFNPLNFTLRKSKKAGIVISLFTTFFISGLWHGAAWTFIIWGLLHGTMLSVEVILNLKKRVWEKVTSKILKDFISIASTAFIFITVSLISVFFKANSAGDAFYIIGKIFSFSSGSVYIGSSSVTFFLNILVVLFLLLIEILQYRKIASLNFSETRLPIWIRWPGYASLIICIFLFGKTTAGFIYFQF